MCDYLDTCALASSPKIWGCTSCCCTLDGHGETCYICGNRYCFDCIEVRNTQPDESPYPSEEVICKECHNDQYGISGQSARLLNLSNLFLLLPEDSDKLSIKPLSASILSHHNVEHSIMPLFKRVVLLGGISPHHEGMVPLTRKVIDLKQKFKVEDLSADNEGTAPHLAPRQDTIEVVVEQEHLHVQSTASSLAKHASDSIPCGEEQSFKRLRVSIASKKITSTTTANLPILNEELCESQYETMPGTTQIYWETAST